MLLKAKSDLLMKRIKIRLILTENRINKKYIIVYTWIVVGASKIIK